MKRREFFLAISVSSTAGCSSWIETDSTTESLTTQSFTRLEITSTIDDQIAVLVRLSSIDDGNVVYEERVDFNRGSTETFDSEFKPEMNYELSLVMDAITVFNRPIYAYEGYELIIRSKENVEVESHIEN
jgi:hypothetical protein